jgi:hypothetical protein
VAKSIFEKVVAVQALGWKVLTNSLWFVAALVAREPKTTATTAATAVIFQLYLII